MAEFRPAFEKTLNNEGGYCLHKVPGDFGGMTYAGISRHFHPNWHGWKLIDKGITSKAAHEILVKSFYKEKFWRRIQGDKVLDQDVAESIYDFAVNVGPKDAAKLVQAVVEVEKDGIIGPITLAHLNSVSADLFRVKFFVGKIAWYASICNRTDTQNKFLLGWVNRSLKQIKERM